jgi:hypothetical protein
MSLQLLRDAYAYSRVPSDLTDYLKREKLLAKSRQELPRWYGMQNAQEVNRDLCCAYRILPNAVKNAEQIADRIKDIEDRTEAHDKRPYVHELLQELLPPNRSVLDLPGPSTTTPAIWDDPCDGLWGDRRNYAIIFGQSLSSRLGMTEMEIERRSSRLAQLHEEREIDYAVHRQDIYQQIQLGWKKASWFIPRHHCMCWGKIKTLLEPEYKRQWQKAVAETENLLALARDEANHLRGRISRSRVDQLEQLVSNRTQSQRTHKASEPFIKAQLNETEVSAFPDTGAAANFMSLQYVKDHGLKLDRASSSVVELGNGSTVSTLGTTTSLFSFAGEEATHTLHFNVLRTSVYDVVLGSPFLKATETLTRYTHRVGQRFREALSYRVCALGAAQRVSGRLNGVHIDATPDTGSDVSLVSASLAARRKLKIRTDTQHRVLLKFADGSTARATGLVENLEWVYGDTGAPHRIDVYVLPELSVDLLLGYDFLHDTNAFVAHEDDFWSGDDIEKQAVADEHAVAWLFWIIKLVRKAVKDQRASGSRRSLSCCTVAHPQPEANTYTQITRVYFFGAASKSNGELRSAKSSKHTVSPKRSQSSCQRLNDFSSWNLISLVGKSFLRPIRATHRQLRTHPQQRLLLPTLEPFRRRLLDQHKLQPLWHLSICQSRPASLGLDGRRTISRSRVRGSRW